MKKYILIGLLLEVLTLSAVCQEQPFINLGTQVSAYFGEGIPIREVVILLKNGQQITLADSLEKDRFYKAFHLKPGAIFREQLANLAIARINEEPNVLQAKYELYNNEFSGSVLLLMRIDLLQPGQHKIVEGRKGSKVSGSLRDFPLIYESSRAKFSFILNGATGLYHEENALFGQGPAFTQGNPIADDPAGKGPRFWGEAFIEPGIGGITQLGRSKLYAYGAVSTLITGRNTSDIYSKGSTWHERMERLYGGMLFTRLGRQQDINIDLSYGRQFFQLNEGFLFARFSGNANAGPRGSVYLNSRTTFHKAGLLKAQKGRMTLQGFYLQPGDLFQGRGNETQYLGGNLQYNDNRSVDASLAYITITSSKASYRTPNGTLPVKGLRTINPKLFLQNIFKTGFFFKTEYAHQWHSTNDQQARAYYLLGGYKFKKGWKPSIFYRYAYMSGDEENTNRYEKFDPMLSGGLGNWVQGLNFKKVSGNGNIISHRLNVQFNPNSKTEFSLDYFHLQADSRLNQGGLAPINKIDNRHFGQEYTLTVRHFLNQHFMFLGVLSHANPGGAIRNAFVQTTPKWTTIQGALFMFF